MHSALYPVIDHLQRLLQLRPEDTPADAARQAGAGPAGDSPPPGGGGAALAALLSVPLREALCAAGLSPQQQRQKTLEALVAWLVAEAERQPVLAVWEDLHWADPSTLELLGLLLDQTPTAPLLHPADLSPGVSPRRGHPAPI